MKANVILMLILIFSVNVKATVRIVDNNVNSPSQFKTIASAINASVNGDTLYIQPSSQSYGNVTLNKQLTLIGGGHKPLTENMTATEIDILTLDSIVNTSGCSNSRIFGFKMLRMSRNSNISWNYYNIEIANSIFTSGLFDYFHYNYNLYVHNNIFQASFNFGDNSIITNNIFYSNGAFGVQQIGLNSIIRNNLFLGSVTGTAYPTWDGNTIENNIFYGIKLDTTNTTNCAFLNNIGFGGNYLTIPFGVTNSGSGNILQNPQFTSVASYSTFNYNDNFRLLTSSPGHNAGTDGNDIGLYGGGTGSIVDLTGMPQIPYIEYLRLTQSVIAPGDQLNVQFKGVKHD